MKNNILFALIFIMVIFFTGCSKPIKKLEISDGEFLFTNENFKKQYTIEAYLKSFDVGVIFKEPILKDKIILGSLEVIISLNKGPDQKITLSPDVRYFYSNYENNLVNKIYFQSITLDDKEFINELEISVIKAFDFPNVSELLIRICRNRGIKRLKTAKKAAV